MYRALNYFFFLFHTLVVLFVLTGWVFRGTRPYHLALIAFTAFSWFVLGIWYGWGYCFCTDWHWKVRKKLGLGGTEGSYIHMLVMKISGINFSVQLVDKITTWAFFVCTGLSIVLNAVDFFRK